MVISTELPAATPAPGKTDRARIRLSGRAVGPALLAALLLTVGCGGDATPEGQAEAGPSGEAPGTPPEERIVRVAVFNIFELSTDQLVDVDELGVGRDPQARAAAEIIQRVRPEILLVNEIDQDLDALDAGRAANARRFADSYLATGSDPIDYPYAWSAPTNTGILTGLDVDGNGVVATDAHRGERLHGNDSFGFGTYPGQYSMALLSQYPVDEEAARTFQRFLWRDLPGHHMPPGHLAPEVVEVFRLSSKSHWDVPVLVGDTRLHLLASHPTPPVFDGEEDLNGRRNFDEIAFWAEYLDDGSALYDDSGERGGYRSDDPFVILGDLNARPDQQESIYDGRRAIELLLDHPRVQDTGEVATSAGGLAGREPGPPGYKERSTTGFFEGSRVDYVLPSRDLEVVDGGVFWPAADEDPRGADLAERASDHRLVWIDIRLPEGR